MLKLNTIKKEEKYWCYEGGTHHYAGNNHKYYKTFDEALNAAKEMMKGSLSGNYYVDQCFCNLYYPVVEND